MPIRVGGSHQDIRWLCLAPLVAVAVGYGGSLLLGRSAVQAALVGLALGLGTGLFFLLRTRTASPREGDREAVYRQLDQACCLLELDPASGVVTWASSAAVRLLSSGAGGLAGRPVSELRPPWAEALARALPGAGRPPAPPLQEHAGPWCGPGPDLVYADTVAFTIERGGRTVTLLSLYDVTDRRRLEESLAQAQEALHRAQEEAKREQLRAEREAARGGALFQHALDAVLLIETESRTIVRANPAAVLLTGYSLEQLAALPFSDLDPTEDLRYSRSLLSGGEPRDEEILLRQANGHVVRVRAGAVPVRSGAWQTLQIILRDLEAEHRVRGLEENVERLRRELQDLEAANRRLEAANRAKAEFLAEMSHEIRTPLNAIVGFSELLTASPDPLSPRQRQFVGDIQTAGEHLLGLMADLLDLAQMEAGRMEVRAEPLALAPLVREVVAVAEALAEPRRTRLVLKLESDTLGAWGDERRVRQALYNLLANAVQYSPPGTVVTVVAQREGQWARVSVSDEGPGIPPELQDHIFEDFVRLPVPGDAAPPPGTGLGLAVSRRLVQAMGGRLTVDSTVGKGSEFTCLLPLYESEAASAPPLPAPRSADAG